MIGVEAYQTLMGSFAVVKDDDTKHHPTHQILTNEEYSELITERNNLRAQLASKKQELENYKQAAAIDKKRALENLRDNANERINECRAETLLMLKERDEALELNKNLKRICKENANAKRGLKPKKEHSGFIITSTAEIFEKVKEADGVKDYRAYKSIVETPYADKRDLTERMKKDAWEDGLQSLFDVAWADKNYVDFLSAITEDENKDKNFIYKQNWRTNRNHLWEIECYHTKPVKIS